MSTWRKKIGHKIDLGWRRIPLVITKVEEDVNEENFKFILNTKSQHHLMRERERNDTDQFWISRCSRLLHWTLNCSFDLLRWAKWMHNKYVILNCAFFSFRLSWTFFSRRTWGSYGIAKILRCRFHWYSRSAYFCSHINIFSAVFVHLWHRLVGQIVKPNDVSITNPFAQVCWRKTYHKVHRALKPHITSFQSVWVLWFCHWFKLF